MQKTIGDRVIKINELSSKNLIADNNWQITFTRKFNKNRKQQIIIHNIHLLEESIKNGDFCDTEEIRKLNTQESCNNYFSSRVSVFYLLIENNEIVRRCTYENHQEVITKIALKYFKMFGIL